MSVTQIDLDDEALAQAMRLSGAKSKKDTVNLALREYAARHGRIAALDRYASQKSRPNAQVVGRATARIVRRWARPLKSLGFVVYSGIWPTIATEAIIRSARRRRG